MKDSRSIAYEVLKAVEVDDAYANLAIAKILKEADLEARDAAFAQEIAFGSLRWKLFYEAIIEVCSRRKIDEIDISTEITLLIGIHQLLNMRVPSHAAINETVQMSKSHLNQGAVGFVNSILRRVSEKSLDDWHRLVQSSSENRLTKLSTKYSHPEWIIKAYEKALKLDGRESELEALLDANNESPLVNVVQLPGFSDRDGLVRAGLESGTASPLGFVLQSGNPMTIADIKRGYARVQDQGSQLVALALVAAQPVQPGEQWLDLCAGPGGKAALLAALANKEGCELTCNEISPHRAELVSQALAPLSPETYVRVGDGRELGTDAPNSFDRILIDAPCTGLGSLRRKPEARWRKDAGDIPNLVNLQKELLASSWEGLKPGGLVVYATCSPHASETVSIIDWATKNLDGCRIIDAQEVLHSINKNLNFNTERLTAQLWPHVHGTDGMFLGILQKPIG